LILGPFDGSKLFSKVCAIAWIAFWDHLGLPGIWVAFSPRMLHLVSTPSVASTWSNDDKPKGGQLIEMMCVSKEIESTAKQSMSIRDQWKLFTGHSIMRIVDMNLSTITIHFGQLVELSMRSVLSIGSWLRPGRAKQNR